MAPPDTGASGTSRSAVCACGTATITVEGPPAFQGICHCDNCKRRTGSGFGVSTYFPVSKVLGRSGEMRLYAFDHAAQSHRQERHFCARCGTTLYWTISTMPELIGIAGGCFAGAMFADPGQSLSHDQKERWLSLPTNWTTRPA